MTRFKADLTLILTAFLWGTAFVAQRVAAQHLGFFTFNGLRFLLGAVLILGLMKGVRRTPIPHPPALHLSRAALAAGMVLWAASALQQAGIRYTTAGNAGFLTSLYVVLTPILLVIFFHARIRLISWLAAGTAVVGAYLLSGGGYFRLGLGDGLEIIGAVLWALQIIIVGWAMSPKAGHPQSDVLGFSTIQYLTAAAANLVCSLLFEVKTYPGLALAGWTVIYTGVFSIAIAYTLQATGQRHAPPGDAAILLSLEAVFAALCGWLILSEKLLPVQLLGCALILGAILFSSLAPAEVQGQPIS